MKRKITLLALAGNCGGLTDSGFVDAASASSARRPARATMPKPLAKVRRALRLLIKDWL